MYAMQFSKLNKHIQNRQQTKQKNGTIQLKMQTMILYDFSDVQHVVAEA